jgi:hypothetical protein
MNIVLTDKTKLFTRNLMIFNTPVLDNKSKINLRNTPLINFTSSTKLIKIYLKNETCMGAKIRVALSYKATDSPVFAFLHFRQRNLKRNSLNECSLQVNSTESRKSYNLLYIYLYMHGIQDCEK